MSAWRRFPFCGEGAAGLTFSSRYDIDYSDHLRAGELRAVRRGAHQGQLVFSGHGQNADIGQCLYLGHQELGDKITAIVSFPTANRHTVQRDVFVVHVNIFNRRMNRDDLALAFKIEGVGRDINADFKALAWRRGVEGGECEQEKKRSKTVRFF